MNRTFLISLLFLLQLFSFAVDPIYGQSLPVHTWIRINQLGYLPDGSKTAVWCSKQDAIIASFYLTEASTGKVVYKGNAGPAFGAWGPFAQTYRLNFSSFKQPGRYVLRAGNITSPAFNIGPEVYEGAADFCLRYMRQQRSGFNPFLQDSCHTHDGYTMYGPMPDSTFIDVSGGWHDASDYLQYATTSANATYHLLMAYRDFPQVFGDRYLANGLPGKNVRADVMDEAKWGLEWLLKMHPKEDWLFNQVGDDRDHAGMRIPKEDSFYGKGFERPVYFCTGTPQGLFRYKNRSTGVASTAGKFASAFALGSQLFREGDSLWAKLLQTKSLSAYQLGLAKKGVCQTAPGRAPYFYEEDNWTDDMELANVSLENSLQQPGSNRMITSDKELAQALDWAKMEPVTPWLGEDTARHYQWYPFINMGHYELAKRLTGKKRKNVTGFYKEGIEQVWKKAKRNAFYHGIPFIWCSNNLTTSFAIQCYWYRELTGDEQYVALEQACFDWLFGCNPWGTSMVFGLPATGDFPRDPHSAFTHLKQYPIDGGLVDGPVYGSIYKRLIGITLHEADEYADLQSDLVVYHDDYGDYSTNEPTMDGTASLIYLLASQEQAGLRSVSLKKTGKQSSPPFIQQPTNPGSGKAEAITRGDTLRKEMAIVFTGDEFGEGGEIVAGVLKKEKVKASFFFTGRFYRQASFSSFITQLKNDGHYLGAHSDQHLLYCDWTKRDSLLVTRHEFAEDLNRNFAAMKRFGISQPDACYFLPPYEWYNDSIVTWARQYGLQLINYTPGTLSAADYTTISMKNYRSSEQILESIYSYEKKAVSGLNGFVLLMHIGAGPGRSDKFYDRLPALISYLRQSGYSLVTIPDLLKHHR